MQLIHILKLLNKKTCKAHTLQVHIRGADRI